MAEVCVQGAYTGQRCGDRFGLRRALWWVVHSPIAPDAIVPRVHQWLPLGQVSLGSRCLSAGLLATGSTRLPPLLSLFSCVKINASDTPSCTLGSHGFLTKNHASKAWPKWQNRHFASKPPKSRGFRGPPYSKVGGYDPLRGPSEIDPLRD